MKSTIVLTEEEMLSVLAEVFGIEGRSVKIEVKPDPAEDRMRVSCVIEHEIPSSLRWIEGEGGYRHCPLCGFETEYPEEEPKKCPGCGARLKGSLRNV